MQLEKKGKRERSGLNPCSKTVNQCLWSSPTYRTHFISDKNGISITSERSFENGKLHLRVEETFEVFKPSDCNVPRYIHVLTNKQRKNFTKWCVLLTEWDNPACEEHWNRNCVFHLLHTSTLAQVLVAGWRAESDQTEPPDTKTRWREHHR